MANKYLRIPLLLFLLTAMSTTSIAYTYDREVNGIRYTLNDDYNTAEVTYYSYQDIFNGNYYSGKIVIPRTIMYEFNVYTVTAIGSDAFYSCDGLTSVTIPNSVKYIGDGAFSGCGGLTSITIPNSVTSIGHGAFAFCEGLTSVTIPSSVRSIGNYAFKSCPSLTSVTIPNSVTSLGDNVFEGCTVLTSVNIPNSVTTIGYHAFFGCAGLTSVTIPNSVETIDGEAFYDCSGLTSITIPNSVTNIGDHAFFGCTGLSSIRVDSGNAVYDSREDCNAIIRKEDNELIRGCNNTIIPNSVTRIGEKAFNGCAGLTSVTIPNSVTSIAWEAFANCTGLSSVIIPNSVTSIGDGAFSCCNGLASNGQVISFIRNPFGIRHNTFDYHYEDENGYGNSDAIYKGATLYVPYGTRELYWDTSDWYYFYNIVEMKEGEDENGRFLPPIDTTVQNPDTPDDRDDPDNPETPDDPDNPEKPRIITVICPPYFPPTTGRAGGIFWLSDVIVDKIYYNLDEENGDGLSDDGEYLVLNKPMSMSNLSAIEGKFIGAEELKENFHGLIFKVPEGSGVITIDAQTFGTKQLGVRVGDDAPQTYRLFPRGEVEIPYSVSEPTYIYVYATDAAGRPAAKTTTAVATGEGVQLHSIAWSPGDATGIAGVQDTPTAGPQTCYDLTGRRTNALRKGINLVRMEDGSVKKVLKK